MATLAVAILCVMLEDASQRPAGGAVRAILADLFEIIQRHESVVIKSSEPKSLHDFRVGVRRTRVALGQARAVIPRSDRLRFGAEFKWVGRTTGLARDLDVFERELGEQHLELAMELREESRELVRRVRERRAQLQRRVVDALRGERYVELKRAWTGFLGAPSADGGRKALEPIGPHARRWVSKARGRVLDRGSTVDADSPATDFHRVRIAGKKLRYLLEFYADLERPEVVEARVTALKRLQDNLGRLNDWSFQRRLVRELGEESRLAEHLLAGLARAEKRERREFAQVFAQLRDGWVD